MISLKAKKVKSTKSKLVRKRPISRLESRLECQLKAVKIPYEKEYKFHKKRLWRFDFFINPDICVECQGGIFINGGHSRGRSYERDCLKMNEAVKMGYKVLWFTLDQIKSGYALDTIRYLLGLDNE